MKKENIIDIIKFELLDTKVRLEMKLKGELFTALKLDNENVVRRIKRLEMIINSLDQLNSIPLK